MSGRQPDGAASAASNDLDALLTTLAERGVRLTLRGARIAVDAPRGALTAGLRAALAEQKHALIAHLSGAPAAIYGPVVTAEHGALASFAQQRVWFLDRLEPGSGGYHIPVSFRVRGPMHAAALERALAAVARRHGALRTRFADPTGDGVVPRLVVDPPGPVALPIDDLEGLDPAARPARIDGLARAVGWGRFDLATGPLWRARWVRLGPAEHILLLAFHHAVFDGLSLSIFLEELSAAYAACRAGEALDRPPLAVQYVDFAAWQRRRLTGPRLAALVGWWRDHLAGAPALIDLPTDRPRPARQGFDGARIRRSLSPELTARLDALARAQRVTPNMLLLAAFATLMGRLSGQDDLVIGTPIANRGHRSLEELIGFLANTLALRCRPVPTMPFVDLLAAVRQTSIGAQAHQSLPFERVVEALDVERSLDRNPLFQVMFSYQAGHTDNFALAGAEVTPVEFEHEGSAFDLTLNLRRHATHLAAIFEYDRALFDAETIERLADGFEVLLGGIIEGPGSRLIDLPWLTPDHHAALEAMSRSDADPPADRGPPPHRWFAERARRHPDAVAVSHGDRHVSYGALCDRVRRISGALVARGVGPGDRVAVCIPRSIDTVAAVLGIVDAGAAYVPLDPEQPALRLAGMLTDCAPALLIAPAGIELASDGLTRVELADLDGPPLPEGPPRAGLDDLAYIIYTSGSTGRPKGVMITHRALLNTHHGYRIGYGLDASGEGLSHLQMANPAFDVFTGDWVRALANGGRLVLCDTALLSDPAALHRLIVDEGIGFAEFVPVVVRGLCDHLEATGQRLDGMACVVVSSDIFHVRDYRRLKALCRPDARVTNTYGVTEAAIDSTIAEAIDPALTGDAIAHIGRPMAGTRAFVLDAALRPVAVGVRGELCIGGAGVAAGYWQRPELTAEKYVEVEVHGGRERVYRTGDRARWRPGGELEFFGRMDHQVQLRGLRIEAGEIEAALLAHPVVRSAVVMLRGHADPMLVAWVVLGEPLSPLAASLRAFLELRIPRYMVPSAFVALDALPTTANGKIDRKALPDPEAGREGRFVQPRDRVELELILIWERLLDRAPIGVTDDFFALGGDSLLTVRLVSIIERTFGVRVPLHLIFSHATPEQLAMVLRRADARTPWSPLVCLQPEGDGRPLFFVHAAGGIVFRYIQVAALLGEGRPFYGLQARGIEPGDPLYPSIEAMAADYVKAMRAVQPTGPYLIGGWSLGGSVAFEMTRILEAEGESVPTLLMVDASAPDVDDYETDDVEFLLERLRPAAGLELAEIDDYSTPEGRLRYLFEQQRLAGLLAPDIADADAALRLAVHKHHNRIVCAYRPAGPCEAHIVFVEPDTAIAFDARMKNPAPAWRPFARGGLEVHRSRGNHFDMFSETNSPALAAVLTAVLDRLDPDTLALSDPPRQAPSATCD